MELNSLERGRFLRREDDNHARIQLINGQVVVAHCPSENCFRSENAPGQTVEISQSASNGSQIKWSLERLWIDKCWVGLNAKATNRLVMESIVNQEVTPLKGYTSFEANTAYAKAESTDTVVVDARFQSPGLPDLYLDVRNVTRLDENSVRYPDFAHQEDIGRLDSFESMIDDGFRVVTLYAVNRVQGEWFEPGYDVDNEYCERLEQAQAYGVELMVARVRHSPSGISLSEVST